MGGETPGSDLVLVAFQSLTVDEQDDVFERISQARLDKAASEEAETTPYLRSLERVAEHLRAQGEPLTSVTYRKAWAELNARGEGEGLHSLGPVIRHFGGTWRRAKEAYELYAGGTTARMVEARFRRRRLGKVWRYTERTLREALERCIEDLGLDPAPSLSEYEDWRQHQLRLARAEGNDDLHIPSNEPFRRYGGFGAALSKLGFSPEQVAARLERQ